MYHSILSQQRSIIIIIVRLIVFGVLETFLQVKHLKVYRIFVYSLLHFVYILTNTYTVVEQFGYSMTVNTQLDFDDFQSLEMCRRQETINLFE